MNMSSKTSSPFISFTKQHFSTRLQPDSSNTSNSDESKPSVADSVMIDNQADYDEIFRGRVRLPRSPSHQAVSAPPTVPPPPPPSSSSAGFSVPTEIPPVKPKSPPPQVNLFRITKKPIDHFFQQVDKLMPPIQMPTPAPVEQVKLTLL